MTKKNQKFIFYFIITILLTLGLSISLQSLLAAWNPPTASPPSDNTPAPIYASGASQTITGDLGITGNLSAFQITANGDFYANSHTIYMGGADWSIAFSPTYPDYGIFYDEGSPDKIVLSADGGGAADTDFVLSGDKVGIGTESPDHKLQVLGNVMIGETDTTGGSLYLYGTTAGKYSRILTSNGNLHIDPGYGAGGGNGLYLNYYNGGTIYFGTGATGYHSSVTTAGAWNLDSTLYTDGSGNVGIGTAGPGAKLDVEGGSGVITSIKTDGYVEDVSGVVHGNLVSSHSWIINSGSVGIFNQNGGAAENSREWGVGPHGNRTILWKATPDAISDADGGWNSAGVSIDHTKTYRSTVWIKKTGSNDGTTYLGCSGATTNNLNGTPNINPYFWAGDLPSLNKWYLLVGYIHGSGDTSITSYGGIYDGETGKKVISMTDYENKNGATTQVHRTYLYYSTLQDNNQYWWDPRFEEVNGKEPSIEALLGLYKGATKDQVSYFGGNVGIGTTDPGYPLEVSRTGSTRAQVAIYAAGDEESDLFFGSNGQKERYSFTTHDSAGGYDLYLNRNNGGWSRMTAWDWDTGNVGIGSKMVSPAAKLEIYASGADDLFLVREAIAFGLTATRLIVKDGGNVGIGSVDPGTYKLYVDGDMWADTYSGTGCDIAERYEVSQDSDNLEAGDVVILDSNEETKVKKSNKPYDTMVIGVISTNPSMTMGVLEDNEGHPPVALLGKVPTKVTTENGPIKVGDNIVSSSKPGHGMKCDDFSKCQGAIIGKALQKLESGEGIIEILIKGGF
jgi:hypothetical protein